MIRKEFYRIRKYSYIVGKESYMRFKGLFLLFL
jgi:hypothetical protein